MSKNRLATETSPYLQQHAANPVHWYAWGPEAFEAARASGKPVLLSIGYSACHWCHVMAHESFEDAATAALMNELFVNIKVDREERPDIDKIYQFAHQVLTQRGGGWPLTMFLTHDDQKPFFGGTYFPDKARYGMPAFSTLLKRVAEYYRDQRDELRAQNDTLMDVFGDLTPAPVDASECADRGAARRRARAIERHVRQALRRIRRRAEVSAPRVHRPADAPLAFDRRDAGAGSARAVHGDAHAHAHGRRRHVRPAGRRLRALFGRPVLDDSALREDAVRQRRAARDLRRSGARHRRSAVQTHRQRNRRVDAARDAGRISDGRGRLLLRLRRRLRRPRRQVLCLDAQRSARGADAARVQRVQPALRPRRRTEFRRRVACARVRVHRADREGTLPRTCRGREARGHARAPSCWRSAAKRVWPGLDDKVLTSWNALAIRGLAIAARSLEKPRVRRGRRTCARLHAHAPVAP